MNSNHEVDPAEPVNGVAGADFFLPVNVRPDRRHRWAGWLPVIVLVYGTGFALFVSLLITFSSFEGDREAAKALVRVLIYPIGDLVLVATGIAQAFLGYYVSNQTGAILVAIPTTFVILPFGVAQATLVVVLVLLVRRFVRFVRSS